MVHFMNFMHVATHPLLWQWYDEVVTQYLSEKCLNLSQMKFESVSQTIFWKPKLYKKSILTGLNRLSAERPYVFLIAGNIL